MADSILRLTRAPAAGYELRDSILRLTRIPVAGYELSLFCLKADSSSGG